MTATRTVMEAVPAVHLLLSCGSTPRAARPRPDAAPCPLMPWRSVTLLAGAFPEHDPAREPALITPPRLDRALHAQVRAARPRQRLRYGDYSVEHVRSAYRPADSGRYGPPWSLLRYTHPDRFLVSRAPTRGPERADRVRSAARRIVEHESYRREPSAHRGVAEDWLESCAHGTGPTGTGSPETWARIGHAQHLTSWWNYCVIRCCTVGPCGCC